MKEYIKEAVDAMEEEELLESYDKELALKQEYFKEGKKEGYNKGMEDGIEQEKLKTAKNLLKENIPVETIMKVTGLSKDRIEELNEN